MTQQVDKQKHNGKKWLFFSIGLLVGILISVTIYFLDIQLNKEQRTILQTIEHIYKPSSANKDTIVKVIVSPSKEEEILSETDTEITDSLENDSLMLSEKELALEEVEFSIEEDETDDENIVYNKLINRRIIKVSFKDANFNDIEMAQSSNKISNFEVEQWSSPIKNKISYQLSDNILKIKGMDISHATIFYYQGNYYLNNGQHNFLIKHNLTFEKLIGSNIINI